MRNNTLTPRTSIVALAALGVGLSVLGGLAGCETSGGGSGGGGSAAPAPSQMVSTDAWNALGYRLDWQGYASVPGGGRVTNFAIGNDCLVVQESGSRVSLLEKSNGAIRWTNQLASRLTRFTSVDVRGNSVWASSESELIGLDIESGDVVARQRFARVVNTPPLFSGGVAVYGTASGEVIGHLTTANVKLWGFQSPGAITTPAVDVNGIAAIVSQSGDVMFLDPQTGTLYAGARMFRGVESAPASGDGAAYVASLDQSIYAFEPSGGVRWRYRTEYALRGKPVFHAGVVYCEVPQQGMVALDARTGGRRWNNPEVRGTVVAQRNGMLVVFNGREALLVDPGDGGIVERQSLSNVARVVAEQFTDGAIYTVSSSGAVARLVPGR